ncbi:murein biosynthesis integral membrane protein MurJ [Patescibacteria group bacterium]|uniref:Probable lipid II flippase MurJ n=1 Tax=candidate division WWE3 bacterium TaxID=2053526 RepID=A0A928Y6X2_UNCKA|nr:murein biosynthesis integral membrane protein MurJ [candidate division WWE3 bacterium]MCL4732422.1 murein biosynthesis integral membrane protein MurJ [Patescibacteria group bacterium]MDL1952671.1 murein biosynthesis integral membrane protein MurJ [Candidatus Uhrbacteria bacterium UHB]RIL01197.1 MAG: murein biosynthesis integral membrane protein MurJ [Candidatus Uhrbacteria bacterium]
MLNLFRRLWNGETESVTTAAFIVGAASLASRLVGVFRDRVLASTFGAGDTLDAYYAAFRIPDFLYNLVILGALSAAFIPVFTEYLENDKREAWRLAERVLSVVGAAMLVLCAVLFVAAPWLVPPTVPGFLGDKLALTVSLSRIMLLSTFFLALSAVMGGILQATRRFVAFSLAPVFYNLGIIVGVIFFVPNFGPIGLGWGVVLGAALHLFTQVSVAYRLGLERLPVPSFHHEGVRRILRLMAPRTIGLAMMQINLVVLVGLASTLAVGSVAVLNLAMNLQYVPVGIFGISFAVAAFPALSRAASAQNKEAFRHALNGTARKIIFLLLPSMALMLILRAQVVRLVLGQGQFDWNDTIRTADALAIFSFSLLSQALVPLFSRSFFALQNTVTPLWIGAVSEGTNIALALLFREPLGLNGLVLAFTIASWISIALLWWRLRASQGRLGTAGVWISFRTTLVATVVLCAFAVPVRILVGSIWPLRTFWQVALQAGAAAAAGLLGFWVTSWLLQSRELSELREAFIRKLWKRGEVLEGADAAQGH